MYKVFINENVIIFNGSPQDLPKGYDSKEFVITSLEDVVKLIETVENEETNSMAFIITGNTKKQWSLFKSKYTQVKAAGGLVRNGTGDYLFIYRNNKWDLPKGKVEKDEKTKQAAIREVMEECGIKNLELNDHLLDAYHTYTLNGRRILKKTKWYSMSSEDNVFVPQIEEGISEIKWIPYTNLSKVLSNTYTNILEVIAASHNQTK